nr:hypothetical protein [Tanacetum cinerariifolium]
NNPLTPSPSTPNTTATTTAATAAAFPAAVAAMMGCGWQNGHHRRGGAYKTLDFLFIFPCMEGLFAVKLQPHLVVSSCDGATPCGSGGRPAGTTTAAPCGVGLVV